MTNRIRLSNDATLTLMQVPVHELAPAVIVVGDPARATAAAEMLDDARKVGENREYLTYSGTFAGKPVSIASHGVGAAGAAVVFEELCRGGAERIIRAGTAGGLQPEVQDGSLVVATGAVRCDGFSDTVVPTAYPAISDPALALRLADEACARQDDTHTGIVLTSANFYPLDVLPGELEPWARAGAVAVEMELAALLVIASLHGVAAGGVLAIDGNPLGKADATMSDYQPFREIVAAATTNGLNAALTALTA